MKILVTSGATREPIDGVRFISNFSTGRTGAEIASTLKQHKHEVVYLHGVDSAKPKEVLELVEFKSFSDLDSKLQTLLREQTFDAILHLAAVSDYSIKSVKTNKGEIAASEAGKLDSTSELELVLTKNFKIVDKIKSYSKNKQAIVIAFKLTNTESLSERTKAIEDLTIRSQVDYVVHNDLREINNDSHTARIYKNSKTIAECHTKQELAEELNKILGGHR